MANVIAIGQPVNDSERRAIAFLRDNLPDTYTIFHNFEIPQGSERFEVDLAIIAPHSVFDALDYSYQAPECYRDPAQASIASDLFSGGLVFYELLTGETAFEDTSQIFDLDAIFPEKPSTYKPDLPTGIDDWLQKLCAFDPEDRFPSAAVALVELGNLIGPGVPVQPGLANAVELAKPAADLLNLPKDYDLSDRFIIQERLGQGGFGVAYKVFDSILSMNMNPG